MKAVQHAEDVLSAASSAPVTVMSHRFSFETKMRKPHVARFAGLPLRRACQGLVPQAKLQLLLRLHMEW